MSKRIPLKQMAEMYSRCTKTFRKYVIDLGIPHVTLGRDMLFDPVEVDTFLRRQTIVPETPSLAPKQAKKTKTKKSTRYEELLGLR
jgi:hypothetical protein